MSLKIRTIPYTADDLRAIADIVDKITDILTPGADIEDGDWRWGVVVDVPGPEGEDIVGQIKAHGDGWFGFYPWEATD